MSRANVRKQVLEKNKILTKVKEKPSDVQGSFSKHLKRVYPIGLHRSTSSLSLSSVSLSLSQNSNDSSLADFTNSPLEQRISLALRLIAPLERSEIAATRNVQHHHHQQQQQRQQPQQCQESNDGGELRRCNWITKNSDKVYVAFHDECWGVPTYDDNQLFELLALSGMLMDYNWTEILKGKELFREVFAGFDPNIVAKMGEKEITEIANKKEIMLSESRVRCIVDNARCIGKVVREFGSFSSYVWGYMNYKSVINRYKHPRNVPLRSPKAEAMSRDLLKRGFRFVGPVIVHSFMQAAGLTIDHLVDCFRYNECVNLAERPWRHI